MKTGGILLCGGYGTRLLPTTSYINKHLIPIYDKPMIYYSLSILLLAELKDITIVCDNKDLNSFKSLLKDGEEFGVEINYAVQDSPMGIPHGISSALDVKNYEKFICALGDNFIFGQNFYSKLHNYFIENTEATIFTQHVKDPERFGVAELSENNQEILSLVEKPKEFISNNAVIGLYIFDDKFQENFKNTSVSSREEFEIIDIIKNYELKNVTHHGIGRGTAWFDMGTTESFYNSSSFVRTIQERQGLLVCSPHEIAFRNNWIDENDLNKYIESIKGSEYSENLSSILNL